MSRVAADGSGASKPDWRLPALRAGLEVALVALAAAYLALQIDSRLLSSVIVVVGLLGSVAVIVWTVDEHVYAWVRYASDQARRSQREKRRKRRQREQREGRQQRQGQRRE